MVIGRLGALGGLLLAMWPRLVSAEPSCEQKGHLLIPHLAPVPGARDVPLDTWIWGLPEYGTPVLLGEGGVEIGWRDEREIDLGGATLRARQPQQLLEPESIYQVWACESRRCGLTAEFRTGTELAEPPQVPVLRAQDLSPETRERRVYLTVDFAGVLVIADADSEFDGETWEGRINAVHADPDERVRLGHGCGYESWPYESDSAELKFAAFNLAGEMSAWSEPALVRAHEGCRVSGSPGWWSVALVVIGVRRRRGVRRREGAGSTPT